jgi:hypothetical protein
LDDMAEVDVLEDKISSFCGGHRERLRGRLGKEVHTLCHDWQLYIVHDEALASLHPFPQDWFFLISVRPLEPLR